MFVKENAYQLLKQKRLAEGLTGAEVARRMGLNTTQHYWNLENNKNRLTLEYAFLAANALNVPIKFFCQKTKLKV